LRVLRLAIVRSLNGLCLLVDTILYRPAVVLLGKRLPRWWNCGLAKLSVRLDERWGLGYWKGLVPGPPCEACGRRASTVHVGGWALEPDYEPDADDDHYYLARHRVHLCQWCFLDPRTRIGNEADLEAALQAAAARSVSWRWSWKSTRVGGKSE
jgi:hypothetical protein